MADSCLGNSDTRSEVSSAEAARGTKRQEGGNLGGPSGKKRKGYQTNLTAKEVVEMLKQVYENKKKYVGELSQKFRDDLELEINGDQSNFSWAPFDTADHLISRCKAIKKETDNEHKVEMVAVELFNLLEEKKAEIEPGKLIAY